MTDFSVVLVYGSRKEPVKLEGEIFSYCLSNLQKNRFYV